MSIAAVSSGSIYQELQSFFQQCNSEVAQLGQELSSGNVANAQQDFATLQSLGQGGPFANGDAFAAGKPREQDFTAIGQALQSGNLSGAQQAFAQPKALSRVAMDGNLIPSHRQHRPPPRRFPQTSASSSSTSASTQSLYQQVRAFYQQRRADIGQLSQDLASGNTANAQQDVAALQAFGQSGRSRVGIHLGTSSVNWISQPSVRRCSRAI